MRLVRLAHRWTGGLIGLLLFVLGLTGTVLVFKDDWLRLVVPHAAEARVSDPSAIGAALDQAFAAPDRPRSVILASDSLGVLRLNYEDKTRGAYAAQSGAVVARWESLWARPELWRFDLHHYLLIGDTGKTIAGIAGLAGLGFVVTGVILWWPTRRTFVFAVMPRAWKRPGIVKHHRDMGVWSAPVLAVVLTTGAIVALSPLYDGLAQALSPGADLKAVMAQPEHEGGVLSADLDWPAMMTAAQARFPDAEARIVSLPTKQGGLIGLRMRRTAEWLPNGRTQVWFDPADGRIVGTRDAMGLPLGLRVINAQYPIHAAKVGGLAYRLVVAASGLALTLLGSLAVFTFWSNPSGLPKRRRPSPSARRV
ncbi:PepSY-associated TM helix domain-containing protein [Brevundimonas sp.]|uniref:PepSY-associated TM helix domain-containing protein n=1 Tax=Brevundimonas sp. TaxID=1871086 RepID=UPI0028AA2F78|nr:PepSY-associated TM helix domain-containing protein [Brevundimonas sp.]